METLGLFNPMRITWLAHMPLKFVATTVYHCIYVLVLPIYPTHNLLLTHRLYNEITSEISK